MIQIFLKIEEFFETASCIGNLRAFARFKIVNTDCINNNIIIKLLHVVPKCMLFLPRYLTI